MLNSKQLCLIIGCVLMASSVAIGAFGAHGLESRLEVWYPADYAKRQADWETAVSYQVYHSLGLIALGILWPTSGRRRSAIATAIFFIAGIILFSGGLYAWVLSDVQYFIIPVPIGGSGFILGWLCMAWMIAIESNRDQYEGRV